MDEQLRHYERKLEFEIDSWDLKVALENGENVVAVDARAPEAFAREHIPGAMNLPHRRSVRRAAARRLVALLVLAGAAVAQAQAPAPQRVTFRADWSFKAVHAPVFLALERGYYAQQGLQLQFLAGSGSSNAVKSVGSKSDHFGMADATVMARAVSEGAPVRAIAGIQQANPIAIAANPEIRTPKELEGRTLVTTAATGPAQLFPVFAKGAGFDPSKVTIANVAGNAQLSTFMAGRGDAVTVYTNNELQLLQARMPDRAFNVFRYAEHGVTLLNQVLVAPKVTASGAPSLKSSVPVTPSAVVAPTRSEPAMEVGPPIVPSPPRVAPVATETAPLAPDWLPLTMRVPAETVVVPS